MIARSDSNNMTKRFCLIVCLLYLFTTCFGDMKGKKTSDIRPDSKSDIEMLDKKDVKRLITYFDSIVNSTGTVFIENINTMNKNSFIVTMVCLGAIKADGEVGSATVYQNVWNGLTEREQSMGNGVLGMFTGMSEMGQRRMPHFWSQGIERIIKKYETCGLENEDSARDGDISFMYLYLAFEYTLENKYDKARIIIRKLKTESGDGTNNWREDYHWDRLSNDYDIPKASIYQMLNEVDKFVSSKGTIYDQADYKEQLIKDCVRKYICSTSFTYQGWHDGQTHSCAIPNDVRCDTDVLDFSTSAKKVRFETVIQFTVWRSDGDGKMQTINMEFVGYAVHTASGWKVEKIRERI
jgi:hypothetical protein